MSGGDVYTRETHYDVRRGAAPTAAPTARPLTQAGPGVSAAIRTRLMQVAILFWSLPFGIAIMTFFKVVMRTSHVRFILWLWSTGFVYLARKICRIDHRMIGREQVPDQPVIYVSNHQSYWESIAFTSFVRDVMVVSKAEAMKIPVFGWGLRYSPMTPVHRDRPGANLRRIVRDSRAAIAEGRSVLIFPEGTRVAPGVTAPYMRGLELIYAGCGVPIVPVVHNAGVFWRKGRSKIPGRITMRFLPPIEPGKDAKTVARTLEETLNTEKDRLLNPAELGYSVPPN